MEKIRSIEEGEYFVLLWPLLWSPHLWPLNSLGLSEHGRELGIFSWKSDDSIGPPATWPDQTPIKKFQDKY